MTRVTRVLYRGLELEVTEVGPNGYGVRDAPYWVKRWLHPSEVEVIATVEDEAVEAETPRLDPDPITPIVPPEPEPEPVTPSVVSWLTTPDRDADADR